ncbi:MAG TPA: tail fiber domain-containing protein [Ktedonobacteraceae bacterium]|jgi:hypothetical protein
MPIQGLRFNIPTNQESHLSFQATGSFTSYNPNDGFALIALDRAATLLDYDHKLPSQSGGQFPGPINSYLSIYYVDQSGTGIAGQIIVYASPQTIPIPHFWSIGRALQTQVTSVDLVQGSQPGNPPAQSTRMWADSNGHLNLLNSSGVNYTVLDTNNAPAFIAGQPLGTDLYGTVNNGHVGIRYTNSIGFYDSGNTLRIGMYIQGTQLRFIAAGGSDFGWLNQANSAYFATLTSTGLTVTGSIIIGTTLTISGSQGYMPDNNNTIFQSSGVFYFRFPTAVYCQNSSGSSWIPVNASAFTVQSMRSGKTNILPLEHAIDVVAHEDLYGVSYTTIETGEQKAGFIADEWEKVVPEVCAYHIDSNELIGMDYGAVSAYTFQALKDYMAQTDMLIRELGERMNRAGIAV